MAKPTGNGWALLLSDVAEDLQVVNIYVGVTDKAKFGFLAERQPDEVNFWRTGGDSASVQHPMPEGIRRVSRGYLEGIWRVGGMPVSA